MKRLAAVLLSSVLALHPIPALAIGGDNAQSYSASRYPPPNLPNYGGTVGLELDTQPYERRGVEFLKVTSVAEASPLRGFIHPGDFIYSVNGFFLRNTNDFISVVHSGSPGTKIEIDYLDAGDNLNEKGVTVGLLTYAQAFAPPKLPPATTTADNQPWCVQSGGQMAACAVGAMLVIGALAAVLSGGNHSSGGASSGEASGGGSAGDEWRPEKEKEQQAKEKPVDNGVGCYWGYQSLGTCN